MAVLNKKPLKLKTSSWKQEMANMLRDPQELCRLLDLDASKSTQLIDACAQFSLKIPRPYLQRIQKNNLNDPLLLQVLPQGQELLVKANFSQDPLDEASFSPLPGLLHKYHGRVLIVLNGSCAVHCRYCFRRHFPYSEHQLSTTQRQAIVDYIRNDESIFEVILSGGDPLTSSDKQLAKIIQSLENVPHITSLRIHTRLPIVIPQRVTPALLELFKNTRLNCCVVIHSNHANEIDNEVKHALLRLKQADITLLNQSVLLKTINDNIESLQALSKRLYACHVLPYYLHLLDSVQGAAHFAVSKAEALALHQRLQARLPGYLVPKFVQEQPHEKNKTLIQNLNIKN